MSRAAAIPAAALALAILLAPAPASAQPVFRADEDLDFDRPEAWAMKYYSLVSLASGFGAPSEDEVDLSALGRGMLSSLEQSTRRCSEAGGCPSATNASPPEESRR